MDLSSCEDNTAMEAGILDAVHFSLVRPELLYSVAGITGSIFLILRMTSCELGVRDVQWLSWHTRDSIYISIRVQHSMLYFHMFSKALPVISIQVTYPTLTLASSSPCDWCGEVYRECVSWHPRDSAGISWISLLVQHHKVFSDRSTILAIVLTS